MTSTIDATSLLVLRKSPYSESSLVVSGISPDFGRMSFMLRGARRIGRRQTGTVDLFRVMEVQFRQGPGELCSWRTADLTDDYAAVAGHPAVFRTATWLAAFALLNTPAMAPHPRFFHALKTALRRLAEAALHPPPATWFLHAQTVGACMVFLEEHGLLPDYAEQPARQVRRRLLLNAAEGCRETPMLTPQKWRQLAEWIEAMLLHGECRLPEHAAIAGL